MQQVNDLIEKYFSKLHIPSIIWTDVVEVFIIAFLLYHIMLWIKNTRAWALLKGLLVIGAFVLQPEMRKALEELGRKNLFSSILTFDSSKTDGGRLSDRTINEIVKASVEMGKVKTGALIVIQNEQPLSEYERTGIDVDGIVSSQLLINIFEHNTPLHDGAVIIRQNRVTAATCYLPLSDNMALSKDLGTRHRAGVGISEATDSMTVIVSEETGKISVAYLGELSRGLDAERLREMLRSIQEKAPEDKKRKLWKGRSRNEK